MSLQTLNENLDIIQNLVIPFLEDDLDNIQKLDDEPNDVGGLTAAELKAEFDKAGNTIKEYLNETLIPQLSDTVAEAEARATAERERVANENIRIANENIRIGNENTRIGNENTRIENEDARQENETARVNAEQARAKAESERQTAESGRISAEEARVLAEQARVDENTGIVARATEQANRAEEKAGTATTKAREAEDSARRAAASEANAKVSETNSDTYKRSAYDYAEEAKSARSTTWGFRNEALAYRNEAKASEENALRYTNNAYDAANMSLGYAQEAREYATDSSSFAQAAVEAAERVSETVDQMKSLVVNISGSESAGYSMDKTCAEIRAAYTSGKTVTAKKGANIFTMSTCGKSAIVFERVGPEVINVIEIYGDDDITYYDIDIAEFSLKPMVVTLSGSASAGYTANLTTAEIAAAWEAGRSVHAKVGTGSTIYHPDKISATGCSFSSFSGFDGTLYRTEYVISSTGNVTKDTQKLTFPNAEEASF